MQGAEIFRKPHGAHLPDLIGAVSRRIRCLIHLEINSSKKISLDVKLLRYSSYITLFIPSKRMR